MSVINEMLRDLEKRRSPSNNDTVLQGLRATPAQPPAQTASKWLTLAPTIGVVLTMLLGFALIERRFEQHSTPAPMEQPAAPQPIAQAPAPIEQPATPQPVNTGTLLTEALPPSSQQRPGVDEAVVGGISSDPSALIMQEALALLDAVPEPPLPAVAVAAEGNEAPAVRLLGARLSQTDVGTRLTFELSGQTTHSVERDEQGRLQLVLRDTRLTDAPPRLPLGGTLLRSVHVTGEARDVRIQLEPATAVHAQSTMLADEGSARLVLMLEPSADWAETRSEALPASVDEVMVEQEPLLAATPIEAPAEPAAPPSAGSFQKTRVLPSSMETADRAYRRGLDLIDGGVEEIAVRALKEALAYEPAHVPATAKLAATLLRLNRADEAIAALQAGRAAAGAQPAFAKVHARVLIRQDKPIEALARLIEAPPPLRDDPEYHAMIAALYQRGGDHPRASVVFKRLLAVRADRAAWWMGLGISLEGEGKPEDALSAYRNAGQLGGLGADSSSFTHERIEALAAAAS